MYFQIFTPQKSGDKKIGKYLLCEGRILQKKLLVLLELGRKGIIMFEIVP